MKKIIVCLFFTVVMASILSMFAACDNNNADVTALVDNAPDPASIVGERVTAEQWLQTFGFDSVTNVTKKQTSRIFDISEGQYGNERSDRFTMFDGDKAYCKFKAIDGRTETGEAYFIRENHKVCIWERYNQSEDNMQWEYEESDNIGDFPSIIGKFDLKVDSWEGADIKDSFDMFVYDENKKAYVGEFMDIQGNQQTRYSVKVKISDVKLMLTEIVRTNNYEDYSIIRTYQFYDYGITNVTIPNDLLSTRPESF